MGNLRVQVLYISEQQYKFIDKLKMSQPQMQPYQRQTMPTQPQTQQTQYKVQFVDQTQKIMQEHKQRMMPLVRFLKKHGLKFKHAACKGVRVQYFRMDMFYQIIKNKKQYIERDTNLSNLVETIKEDLMFFKRPENTQKLKYPQVLVPCPMTEEGQMQGKFASFKFDTTESKKIYFYIVFSIIIAGVLFPLWPYSLKYAIWVLSMVLLVTLVSIVIARLILYVVLASFGISFWLFPNLFGDYGVLDSLRPIFSVERWETNTFSVVLRILCFGIFLYYCHSIYSQPDFYIENFESAKEVVMDVHDWGVNKIKGDIGNFSQRALTMDKIINQTADAFEQQNNTQSKDQFTSFQEPPEVESDKQKDKQQDKQNINQESDEKYEKQSDQQVELQKEQF